MSFFLELLNCCLFFFFSTQTNATPQCESAIKTPSVRTHWDHLFASVNVVVPEMVSPVSAGCLLHFQPAVSMKRYETYMKSVEYKLKGHWPLKLP